MRNLEHVKHVIIKIGSTSLCNEDGQLDKERILKLIQQIAILKRQGGLIFLMILNHTSIKNYIFPGEPSGDFGVIEGSLFCEWISI